MIRWRSSWLLILLISTLVTACQADEPVKIDARDLNPFSPDALCAYHIGDPALGKELFDRKRIAGMKGCASCHSIEEGVNLEGPSLYGIATSAEERIPGVIPANYIYMSIVLPNYSIVEGYSSGDMPDRYHEKLDTDEITNLVSYLMTLSEE